MDAPKSPSDERLSGLRILVVDDSEDTARMMRLLLRSLGHEVRVAFAGQEAIALFENFRPDVVLLDVMLPDISGPEVINAVRGKAGFATTAFVAVTGCASDQIPPIFNRHFMKPVDHDALNEFLSQLVTERRIETPGPGSAHHPA